MIEHLETALNFGRSSGPNTHADARYDQLDQPADRTS